MLILLLAMIQVFSLESLPSWSGGLGAVCELLLCNAQHCRYIVLGPDHLAQSELVAPFKMVFLDRLGGTNAQVQTAKRLHGRVALKLPAIESSAISIIEAFEWWQ